MLQSYIGCTARERVPISIREWREVPKEKKDKIWHEVRAVFEVPKFKKRWMLSNAGAKWRGFKTKLKKHHMYNKDGVLNEHPPRIYQFIEDADWKSYIEYRQSKEFLESSERHRQLSLQNQYAYRGSRKGYAKYEEEAREELKLPPDAHVPREETWKRSRKRKDGSYSSDVKQVVDKMDSLAQQASIGEIVLSGRHDLLSQALGKEEHPRRVRGVGQDITITQYFGSSRGSMSSATTKHAPWVNDMKAEISYLRELVKILVDERNERNKTNAVALAPSVKGSGLEFHSLSSQGESTKCRLFWPDMDCEVALGTLLKYPAGEQIMLHNVPLEAGYVKVIVDTPIQPQSPLPRPSKEVYTVEDALGVPVAWPEHLVSLKMNEVLARGKKKSVQTVSSAMKSSSQNPLVNHVVSSKELFPKLKIFPWIVRGMSSDDTIGIEMPIHICQSENLMSVAKEYILSWLDKGEVDALHISIYIRCLFETYCNRDEDVFGFVCPYKIAVQSRCSIDVRAKNLFESMIEHEQGKEVYLAPYNAGSHWILIVINPKLNYALWLDPLHGEIRDDAVKVVKRALELYFVQGRAPKTQKEIRWIQVKVIRQDFYTLTIRTSFMIVSYKVEKVG